MGNSGNCEVCSGNQRNQMDMRRQKAMMYENRYINNQMMTRMKNSCDTCENTRVMNNCDTCGSQRMTHQHEDCGTSYSDELRGMPIAMAYVPWQNFGCTYEAMEGLQAGTIFPELEKPFYGRKGMR